MDLSKVKLEVGCQIDELAQMKIDEILGTGADMVVSSCQQCLRTIATRARRQRIDLVVKDLTELVAEAMT